LPDHDSITILLIRREIRFPAKRSFAFDRDCRDQRENSRACGPHRRIALIPCGRRAQGDAGRHVPMLDIMPASVSNVRRRN